MCRTNALDSSVTFLNATDINGTQVKPCRSGLRSGWVTNREYRLKGPLCRF